MGCTVGELLRRCSSAELTEWVAYSRLEPFGQQVDDFRMGILASTLANIHRAPDTEQYTPEMFIPWWEEPVMDETAQLNKLMYGLGVRIEEM